MVWSDNRQELVLPGLVSTLIPESTKLRVLVRALVYGDSG